MKKIPTDQIYIGALVDENDKYIREILYTLHDNEATDIIYNTNPYVQQDGIIKDEKSGLKIIEQIHMKKFLDLSYFGEMIDLLDIVKIYNLFMRNQDFLEYCAFMFGLEINADREVIALKDSNINSDTLIDDYKVLYKLASLPTRTNEEEKQKHEVSLIRKKRETN